MSQAGSLDAIFKSAGTTGRGTTVDSYQTVRLSISKFNRALLKRRFDKMQEKGYRNEITVVKAAIPYFIVFHKFCLDTSWGKNPIFSLALQLSFYIFQ